MHLYTVPCSHYCTGAVAGFPNASVAETVAALLLFVTVPAPLTSRFTREVDSVAPPPSSSFTVIDWLRSGTGWFDIAKMSIRRQPLGAFHFAVTLIEVPLRVPLVIRPPATTVKGWLSSVQPEPST